MNEEPKLIAVKVKGGELAGLTAEKVDELLRANAGELYWMPLLDDEGKPEGTVIFRRGRAEDMRRYRAQVAKGANYTDEADTLFASVCAYPSPAEQGIFKAFVERYSGISVRVMGECLKLSNGEALIAAKKVRLISNGPSPTR